MQKDWIFSDPVFFFILGMKKTVVELSANAEGNMESRNNR